MGGLGARPRGSTGAPLDRIGGQLGEPAARLVGLEPARPRAGGRSELLEQLGIRQHLHEGRRGAAGVPRRVETPAGLLDDLGRPARRRRDHGAAARERLEQHAAERLAVGAVQQAPRAAEGVARVVQLAGEVHPPLQVGSSRPGAQLGEQALALGVHRRPRDLQAQPRDLSRRERDSLQGQVGALPGRQRAEQQHLGLGGHAPVAVVLGQNDSRADHGQPVAQAAVGVEVAPDRLRVDRHAVRARGRRSHQPGDRRSRQEVHVARDDGRARVEPGHRRRGCDRGAHAPGHQQVGADLAHEPAHVARVSRQRAPGAQALGRSTAQLERSGGQREHLDPIRAGSIGQRALGAGEHETARQRAGEIEQRALGAPEHTRVCDGQRQHERGD